MPSSSDPRWTLIDGEWSKVAFGDYTFWMDPLLPQISRRDGADSVVLIGDAFTADGAPVPSILEELLRSGNFSLLDRLCGRFAVCVIKDDVMRVAHDAFGSRSVYYLAGSQFAFSSHAELLAIAFGVPRSDALAKYVKRPEFRKRSVKYLPGDYTVYKGIFALIPNNYLCSDGNVTRRYWPTSERAECSLEEFSAEVDRYFASFVPFVASRYNPVFGITGGVDSRAVFCAFRRLGVSFRGVTWGAGYLSEKEKPVVREIVERLKLEHRVLDPRDYPGGLYGDAGGRSSGNFRGSSSLTESMGQAFGTDPTAAFVRGYGGEILRGFYNLRAKRMQDFNPESLMNSYGSSIRGIAPGQDYKKACTRLFEAFHERANYAGLEKTGFDPSDVFYWEHRMGVWGSAMLNEMDPAVYSLVGFNSRPLFQSALGLPDKQRLTKKLLRDIIKRNDSELGDIPYE